MLNPCRGRQHFNCRCADIRKLALVEHNCAIRRSYTRRDQRAADLAIDPSLIAHKSELAALAEDWDRGAAAMMPWQPALLAPD